MKTYNRSFLEWGVQISVDEEGFIQESKLISKGRYKKFDEAEFKFDLKKVTGLSDFQKKIYSKLLKVPVGETITYKELSKKAGYENASRAVGTAMAKNKVVPIIPCHRVLKSCGALGSYSGFGGASTKQKIIELEAFGVSF